jgi:hypothetical protein
VVVITTTRPAPSVVVVVRVIGRELVVDVPPLPDDVEATTAVSSVGTAVGPSVGSALLEAMPAPLIDLPAAVFDECVGFTSEFDAAQAGTANTTAIATPPMTGRRSRRGRGARCLPT